MIGQLTLYHWLITMYIGHVYCMASFLKGPISCFSFESIGGMPWPQTGVTQYHYTASIVINCVIKWSFFVILTNFLRSSL